ncbi:uncharacterized protein SPAPADRAFT_61615 [Spathaspora passalidarum NRRL Y-27907]|uniref:Protein BCP1 n=1 Tax=Spathaspora passalidarum (strain NRRL Y-27907 / 11-Y1) TaxID=619300 RepID=G3ANM0_SPAPN|nr:uncharacterized protein SPAPADRAFT_61615 [Spathaspora passalidarum NRRL Y-27907]EGW32549.1 hypothetical protein SPAPADRAFT_61615 [Spathaspora passalidarum NRRL Y-27907]
MAKRKQEQDSDSDIDVSSTDDEYEQEPQQQQEGAEEEEAEETVNVDFDFFDLNPDVDFHALKNFLRQLFGDDASQFDISGLADLILTKHSIGTTIKTEGTESDPFAILSVVNLNEHRGSPSIKKLIEYVLSKTKDRTQFNLILKKLLHGKSQLKTGLIVSERLINMPIEVVPPMYNMLLDEMSKAEDSHEKYEFDYFLVVSKVYQLVSANETEEETETKSKKKKIASNEPKPVEMDYFHYEDMVLEEHASYKGIFNYSEQKQETDSRRVFTEYGIDPKLSLLLLDKAQMKKAVEDMQVKFPAPGA